MIVRVKGKLIDVMSKEYELDTDNGKRSGISHKAIVYADGETIQVTLPDAALVDRARNQIGTQVDLPVKLFCTGKIRCVYAG